MALRANRWVVTGAVTAAVLGLAGFGLGAASASDRSPADDAATSMIPPGSATPASSPAGGSDQGESATPLADALDEPDVEAFLDCLGEHGVDVPEITDGNFSLQWENGRLTINGTVIDLAAVGDAVEACEAEMPTIPPMAGLDGLLDDLDLGDLGHFGDGELGPFGADAQRFVDCLAEKGYDFPFGKGALAGGWLGRNADAEALVTILERTADALRARLAAGAGSDVEQRLAALDAAIEALKADAANAPAPGPEAEKDAPDLSGLGEAIESCKAELGGD